MNETPSSPLRAPSADHLEGFFHGMKHALDVAEGRKRGKLSRQSHAIRTEMASLTLMAEKATGNDNAATPAPTPAPVVFPVPHTPQSLLKRLIGAAVLLGFGALMATAILFAISGGGQ